MYLYNILICLYIFINLPTTKFEMPVFVTEHNIGRYMCTGAEQWRFWSSTCSDKVGEGADSFLTNHDARRRALRFHFLKIELVHVQLTENERVLSHHCF